MILLVCYPRMCFQADNRPENRLNAVLYNNGNGRQVDQGNESLCNALPTKIDMSSKNNRSKTCVIQKVHNLRLQSVQWGASRLASSQLATIRLSEPFSFRFCFGPVSSARPQMFQRKLRLIRGLVPVRISYYVSYITTNFGDALSAQYFVSTILVAETGTRFLRTHCLLLLYKRNKTNS